MSSNIVKSNTNRYILLNELEWVVQEVLSTLFVMIWADLNQNPKWFDESYNIKNNGKI